MEIFSQYDLYKIFKIFIDAKKKKKKVSMETVIIKS